MRTVGNFLTTVCKLCGKSWGGSVKVVLKDSREDSNMLSTEIIYRNLATLASLL